MTSEDEDMECEYQSDASDEETTSSFPQALPSISQTKYNVAYDNFQKWNMLRGTTPITESVLIKYFTELAEKNKPTTIWAIYSMLNATLRINDNIDISSYSTIIGFLRNQSAGYTPDKKKLFTRKEIEKFINDAPDEKWLDLKVVCILAINGVYGSNKFVNIQTEHIKLCNDMFLVSIPKSEASKVANVTFTITGTFFNIVRKYVALRPRNANEKRFFLQYRNSKCTTQPIGKNTFAGMPQRIAKYLKLPEVERYAGLSFRINSDKLGAATCVEQRNEYLMDYGTIKNETSSVIHPVSSNRSNLNDDIVGSSNQFSDDDISSEDEDMEYRLDAPEEEINPSLGSVLSSKSQAGYKTVYKYFQKWNAENGAASVSESLLMTYFRELAQKSKPTTLCRIFSMLKATLGTNDNVDISSYSTLLKFIKKQKAGYTPAKSKLFTTEEIEKFINEASDQDWLHFKVVCIFAANGAHSPYKLTSIKIDHVKQYDDLILVTLPETETSQHVFTITGSFYDVVRRYMNLRSKNAKEDRFFSQYRGGRCTTQNIGRNSFAGMPRRIAKYLKLPQPDRYTMFSFRFNSCKFIGAPTKDLNSTSVTEVEHSEQRVDQDIITCIERSENYATCHRKVPSAIYTAKDPVTIASSATNYYNGTEKEHVCSISCGQVKCASEENEKSVLHAFTLMKPSHYDITEVIPVQYAAEPYCRWIVSYAHTSEPVSPSNADEKFKTITKSIPNNVRIDQKYISGNSSQHSAAYVVVYGVNCECQKESSDVVNFAMNEIKCEI